MYRLGILSTHPIQYYTPWYRELAKVVDLQVFYCHRQSSEDQRHSAFGVAFEWDIPLLEGYQAHFLTNHAERPDVSSFRGCNTPQITEIIHQQQFDAFIVHGWYTRSFWQAMIACWQTCTPLMVRGDSHLLTPRNPAKRMLKFMGYRTFIPRFDAYLVVGKRAQAYYRHYGAPQRKMFFAPHSVDNSFFAEQSVALKTERRQLRASWGIPEHACVFLYAGKLAAHKRPDDYIKAITLAYHHNQSICGLIAGDGPMRSKLEQIVRNQQLPITFAGFLNQSNMPAAYAASNILVVPSDETWGLVVNEAMASGLPAIVAHRAGCVPDLINPGRTGAIFSWGRPSELAQHMLEMATDQRATEHMGHIAQRHIQRYSAHMATAGTMQAIRSISP